MGADCFVKQEACEITFSVDVKGQDHTLENICTYLALSRKFVEIHVRFFYIFLNSFEEELVLR